MDKEKTKTNYLQLVVVRLSIVDDDDMLNENENPFHAFYYASAIASRESSGSWRSLGVLALVNAENVKGHSSG